MEMANRSLTPGDRRTALSEFPDVMLAGEKTALGYLESGLQILLREEHRFLTIPAIEFMARRIGAERLMTVFA